MELMLNSEEKQQLMEILEEHQRELLVEISRSKHHHEFRSTLQKKEQLLESIIHKLEATQAGELTSNSA
ncbi:MAG TPA: hypothetical protein VJY33_00275 [Isosphaeraceae bacterium]|nr:hypothetical protein [Isosphaeraceae bacterium]